MYQRHLSSSQKKVSVSSIPTKEIFSASRLPNHRRQPQPPAVLLVIFVVSLYVYKHFRSSRAVKVEQKATSSTLVAGDFNMLEQRGELLFKQGDFQGAWSSFSSASKLAPSNPEIWNDLGLASKMLGKVDEARRCYLKALELKSDYPEALNNLAVLEMRSGDIHSAFKHLKKALKLKPAYPEANFHMALLYDQDGKSAKAVKYYRRFLKSSANFPSGVVELVKGRIVRIGR